MALNVSKQLVENNILSSSRRNIPWLDNDICTLSGKIAIIGGAPSIKVKLDELRAFDGQILATNGTHDFLIDNGVTPDFFFQLDARKCNKFAQKRQGGCVYILASQCHPDSFESINPDLLVHVEMEGFPYKRVNQIGKNKGIEAFTYISGKGTVGITSIALAYTLGFREIHLYGMDGSFDDLHHAYHQPQNEMDKVIEYAINGKRFKTTPELCNQMWNFQHLIPLLKGCDIHMKSEGLIKEVWNELKTGS
jgi:hypothetical protein